MVRLFVARIFRGGGDSDAEGLDLGVGLVLTLLALPGGFVSILLFEKYGTLLQWMRGATNIDPFASAIPDEYFFITLSMAVTGAVAVWRWDAIFPDRRDYMNLVPLPISTRTIFFANLVAVLFLVGLIAIDVNAASSILFPLVVGATQNAFLFFLRFAAVHALGVVLASVFSFFAVFSVLGLRDGGVAGTRIQKDLALRSRARRGLSGDFVVHQFRLARFLAETAGISAGMDASAAVVLVSGILPSTAGARGSDAVCTGVFGSARIRGGDRDFILRLRRWLPAAFHSHCGDERRRVHRHAGEKIAVGLMVRPLGTANPVPKGLLSVCVEDVVPQRISSPGVGRNRRPRPGSRVPGSAERLRKWGASRKGDGVGRRALDPARACLHHYCRPAHCVRDSRRVAVELDFPAHAQCGKARMRTAGAKSDASVRYCRGCS